MVIMELPGQINGRGRENEVLDGKENRNGKKSNVSIIFSVDSSLRKKRGHKQKQK